MSFSTSEQNEWKKTENHLKYTWNSLKVSLWPIPIVSGLNKTEHPSKPTVIFMVERRKKNYGGKHTLENSNIMTFLRLYSFWTCVDSVVLWKRKRSSFFRSVIWSNKRLESLLIFPFSVLLVTNLFVSNCTFKVLFPPDIQHFNSIQNITQ